MSTNLSDEEKSLLEGLVNSYSEIIEISKYGPISHTEKLVTDLVSFGAIEEPSAREDAYTPIFTKVISKKSLLDYCVFLFEEHEIDVYGDNKQEVVIKSLIFEKVKKLQNKNIGFSTSDIPLEEYQYLSPLKTLLTLERRGFFEITWLNIGFDLTGFYFITTLSLLKSLSPEPSQNKVPLSQPCEQKFHFVGGTLYRDHFDGVLQFKEKTIQYNLLQVAFELPFGDRIDGMVEGLDTSGRGISGNAMHLNKKIVDFFKIDDFLEVDHANKVNSTCYRNTVIIPCRHENEKQGPEASPKAE